MKVSVLTMQERSLITCCASIGVDDILFFLELPEERSFNFLLTACVMRRDGSTLAQLYS